MWGVAVGASDTVWWHGRGGIGRDQPRGGDAYAPTCTIQQLVRRLVVNATTRLRQRRPGMESLGARDGVGEGRVVAQGRWLQRALLTKPMQVRPYQAPLHSPQAARAGLPSVEGNPSLRVDVRRGWQVIWAEEEAQGEAAAVKQRVLTLFDLVCIGVGGTVGSGVFVLTGEIATQQAGAAVSLCWLLAACTCTLSGLSYMEMCGRVPSGGVLPTLAPSRFAAPSTPRPRPPSTP